MTEVCIVPHRVSASPTGLNGYGEVFAYKLLSEYKIILAEEVRPGTKRRKSRYTLRHKYFISVILSQLFFN